MKEEDIIKNTGAIQDTYDSRDYQWSEIGASLPPFDWDKGFNVEDKLGHRIQYKNQQNTSSCGGFAWSYYAQVLEELHTKNYEERRPKFIYAQTHVPSGGSAGRDNAEIFRKKGVAQEKFCKSFKEDGTTDEVFITTNNISEEAYKDGLTTRSISYAQVNIDIDMIAQAIEANNGCILGIAGQNNGTWLTEFPKPPLQSQWRHWVYAFTAIKHEGKKYIGFINSWGNVGDAGVQWIGEDYFEALNGGAIWSAWTHIINPNPPVNFQHNFTQLLRYGMRNDEVSALQSALQLEVGFPVEPTGYFGTITLKYVKLFQKKYGLVADGIVGNKSNAVLNNIYA